MSLPPPPPSVAGAVKVCDNCNSDDRWILHNVRYRNEPPSPPTCSDKKLCTCCVLKLHPSAFCPTCFSLHDANSLHPIPSLTSVSGAGKTLTCLKCLSISHSTCVPPNAPKSPYLCPPCSNHNFKFFDIGKNKKLGQKQVLDERSAKVFLLAARIASISMSKAVALARTDVERKFKEAALARKRAKEAIEHFMSVSVRVGAKKRWEMVVEMGEMLVKAWGTHLGCSPEMCASMIMVGLPACLGIQKEEDALKLRTYLREKFKVEVPLYYLPTRDGGVDCLTGYARISHQVYNVVDDYYKFRDAVNKLVQDGFTCARFSSPTR